MLFFAGNLKKKKKIDIFVFLSFIKFLTCSKDLNDLTLEIKNDS